MSSCANCRKETNRKFREENKDYFRNYQLENREQITRMVKEWNQNNTDKLQMYSVKALAKRREALAKSLPEDKQYMKEIDQQEYCCITGVSSNLEVDHVMPLSKGYWGNSRGNLMKLYQPLNSSKHDSNVFNWIEQMEQERLNYLLPEGIEMTVDQFRHKVIEVLRLKAEEKGLTFEQFKQKYEQEYNRRKSE